MVLSDSRWRSEYSPSPITQGRGIPTSPVTHEALYRILGYQEVAVQLLTKQLLDNSGIHLIGASGYGGGH